VKFIPFFKKQDFWIGIFYDKENKIIYFCPFPMIGLKIILKGD
jgi:hypothetical protein